MNQRKRIALFLLVAFGLGVALMVGIFLSGHQKPLAYPREVTKVHRDADGNVEYHVLTFGGGSRIYWDYFDDGIVDDLFHPHAVSKGFAPDLVFFTGWKSVKASGSWDQEWVQERFGHVLALAEKGRLRYWERRHRTLTAR